MPHGDSRTKARAIPPRFVLHVVLLRVSRMPSLQALSIDMHNSRNGDGIASSDAVAVYQWALEELNLRPHAYQACALTT